MDPTAGPSSPRPPSPHPRTIGLAAVNVGAPSILTTSAETTVWSGIRKAPVPTDATLWLSLVNLAGDGQADLTVHGGPDKAVYAYPSEHLGPWADELADGGGFDLGDAPFGENLSTMGVTEADVCIGDVWAWGEALLEICQPRSPCFKLALHRGRPDIQQRFRRSGRTGWYLRVLEPGAVPASGPITVARPDPAGISVRDAHLAMEDRHLDDLDLVQKVADHDRLADQWRGALLHRLGR